MKANQRSRHCNISRWAWVLGAVIVGGSTAGAAEIELRSQVAPSGTILRLGDVAEIRTDDSQEAERLAKVPLMPAPANGVRRFLRMREVRDLLTAHAVANGPLYFSGATTVEIAPVENASSDRRSARPAAPHRARVLRQAAWSGQPAPPAPDQPAPAVEANLEELRQRVVRRVIEYVVRNSGTEADWTAEVNVSQRHLQQLAQVPTDWKLEGGRAPWTGRQQLTISASTPEGDVQIPLQADLSRPRLVAIAGRSIQRGALLTAADIEMQHRSDVATIVGGHAPVGSLDGALGMEATRPIQAGQVIRSGDIQPPLLVERRDEVTVYARGGGLRVRTTARACQSGSQGDLIQVEVPETRERYEAVVVGHREAVVFVDGDAEDSRQARRPDAAADR